MTTMSTEHELDILWLLGAGRLTSEAAEELLARDQRRRVQVLELLWREHQEAAGAVGIVANLLRWWLDHLGRGGHDSIAILQDPFVGIWGESVLRGDRALDDVGAVARLLAPLCGVDKPVEVSVSLVNGRLHLPRWGGSLLVGGTEASLRADGRSLQVTGAFGTTVLAGTSVRSSGGMTWIPAREVCCTAAGVELRVALSNDDPASAVVGPSPPLDLGVDDERRWSHLLGLAWRAIVDRHRHYVPAVQAAARIIVPQHSPDPDRHVSSSNADGLGVIGISFTEDIPTLAVAIVHESRHSLLSAAMHEVDLHKPDLTPRFYAGWRSDPRPIEALLQGACAFSAVTDFWRTERESAAEDRLRLRSSLELERWYRHTKDAIAQLQTSGLLTAEGQVFVSGLEDLVGGATNVDPIVAVAIDDAIAESRVMWLRRSAGLDAPEGDMPTSVVAAWSHRFFGHGLRPSVISVIDWELTGPDSTRALKLAWDSLRAPEGPGGPDGGIAAVLRLARAFAHLGEHRVAAALQSEIGSQPDPVARVLLDGSFDGWASAGSWSSVSTGIERALEASERTEARVAEMTL